MDDDHIFAEPKAIAEFAWNQGPGENTGDWYMRTQQRRDSIEKDIGAFLAQSPLLLEEYETIKRKCARDSIDMAFCQRRLRKIFAGSDVLLQTFAPFLNALVVTESQQDEAKVRLSEFFGVIPRKEDPGYPSSEERLQFGYDVEERHLGSPVAERYLRWKSQTLKLHRRLNSLPDQEKRRLIEEAAQQRIELLEGHPDLLRRFDILRHGYFGQDRSFWTQ